jgi:L-seryl-tRNA(Ser) seleniumtransferase
VPLLEVQVTTGSALALSQRLQQGDPPVHMGERQVDAGILTLNPQTLSAEDDTVLTRCLIDASRSLA